MNRYTREYLLQSRSGGMRDGRNPYGSRGGYVVSSKRGRRRDRAYDDFDNNREYFGGQDYRSNEESGRSGSRRGSQSGGQRGGYSSARDGREFDMTIYGNYDDIYPYFESDYMYDGRGRRDGHIGDYEEMRLSKRDMKEWERNLENEDGSRGGKYSKEQVEQVAKQLGIKHDEEDFSLQDLTMATNMLYSDYCKVLGGDITLYVKLAKAFLCDEDFDGTGAEKLAIYYYAIADSEE